MASFEQKKAMMAAIPIDPDAHIILRLPDSVKTYADFERWAEKDGNEVSKGLQVAFKAIFELHCDEHEATLKKSHVGQLGNEPVTAPGSAHATTTRAHKQKPFQNTAFEENQPPKPRYLVNALGIPITATTATPDKLSVDSSNTTNNIDESSPHATGDWLGTRFRGPRASSFGITHSQASAITKDATSESFARQLQNLKAQGVKVPEPAVHAHANTTYANATYANANANANVRGHGHGHEYDGMHHVSDQTEGHELDARLCQGERANLRGGLDVDWRHARDSSTRQSLVQNSATDEAEVNKKATHAEKMIAYGKTGKAGRFQAKKEDEEEDEE